MRCYTCGELGDYSWDYPDNAARRRHAKVIQPEVETPKGEE